jgi:tetratricopeptide (TPR) repeat protein
MLQPHYVRGKKYLDKKKYERAIKELEKAANEEGDIYYYIDTYSSIGEAYAKSGQITKSISIYRNALQIIYLKKREISARRTEIRRQLNFNSNVNFQTMQDEDMLLGDEEGRLKEREEGIKNKLKDLMNDL